MFISHHRRLTVVFTEILAIIGAGIAGPVIGSPQAAFASAEQPVVAISIDSPAGVSFDSPWVTDLSGVSAWALGRRDDGSGVLARRNLATSAIDIVNEGWAEVGATDGRLVPATGYLAFLAKRDGASSRLLLVDPVTLARKSTYDLTGDDINPRGIGFDATGSAIYVGSNPSNSLIAKIVASTGALANTALQVVAPTTSGIMFGSKFFTTVGTNPPRLVSFRDSPPLSVETTGGLIGLTQGLYDPVLVNTIAWYGTDTIPGRLVGVDFSTRKIVANFSLGPTTQGFRNITIPPGALFAFGTTVVDGSTQLVSIRLSDGARLGTTIIDGKTGATGTSVTGRYVDVTFPGTVAVVRTTTSAAPTVPLDVTAVESNRSLTVSWTPSQSDEPVVTYTATAVGESHSEDCVSTETTCVIRGLINGEVYSVTVRATSYAGSATSPSIVASPVTVPAAASKPRAIRGDGLVTIEWDPVDDGGRPLTGYTVTLQPGGLECHTVTTRCTFTGLANGTAYRAVVTAHSSFGSSPESEATDAVIPATIPTAPIGAVVDNAVGGARVSWTAGDSGGDAIVAHRIIVWNDAEVVTDRETTTTELWVEGLAHPGTYRITIESRNAIGASERTTVWATPLQPPLPPEPPTPPASAPGSPHSIRVMAAGKTTIRLSWVAPNDGGSPITDYRIMTRPLNGSRYVTVKDGVSPLSTVSLKRPKDGRGTYIRVVAVNAVGESAIPAVALLKGNRIYEMPRVAAVRRSDAEAFAGLAARSTPYEGTSRAM